MIGRNTAHAKSNTIQGLGSFSFCLSLPKWFPGLQVEENYNEDGCDQGDGIDGVEQVDLLHDGQVGRIVLLLEMFGFAKRKNKISHLPSNARHFEGRMEIGCHCQAGQEQGEGQPSYETDLFSTVGAL